MLISVNTSDRRPIYLQIIDEVRRAVVLGLVEPDEPLPSVRQLAAELRLNPNTVQQAYRELEREDLVYVRRGRGTFIAARPVGEAERREERRKLARAVAEQALREGYRHGLKVDDLIAALREVAAPEGDRE